MASYRYQNGDRPLDGFTIEHAVGRGGFGEVYYAISDAGRQVALKAVQNYEDIELRGNSHCMNLKSPHLVSIFDVKHTDRGDPFVIMEYVSGPSLRQLLDEAPDGLGPEKSAWFVREIAKGLALLHDNGIVHRDLKPHNVFVEDGYVKVGDYSLSKVITTSHRSGHTVTVGTVHYMAPEISLGRYGQSVDIYALGVLLFEMLTGKPPFLGETMPEVLMKHMSQDVDTSELAEPFASVVSKAMSRDPDERYQSAEEMVEALFGSDSVRDGVSTFSPLSLTVMAQRAVNPGPVPIRERRPAAPVEGNGPALHSPGPPRQKGRDSAPAPLSGAPMYHLGRFWSQITAQFAVRPWPYENWLTDREDSLGFRFRVFLGACTVVLCAAATGAVAEMTGAHYDGAEVSLAVGGTMLIPVVSSLLIAHYLSLLRLTAVPWYLHRLLYAALPLIPVFAFSEMHGTFGRGDESMALAFAVSVPMLLQDWRWLTAPVRPQRLVLWPCLVAGFVAMLTAICGDDTLAPSAIGLTAGTALTVQVVSRFDDQSSMRLAGSTQWLRALGDAIEAWHSAHSIEPASAKPDPATPVENGSAPSYDHALRNDIETRDSTQAEPAIRHASVNAPVEDSRTDTAIAPKGRTSRVAALILSMMPFGSFGLLPVFGLHRFYSGRYFTGLIWLITFGLLGIGQLVDIVMIAVGEFRDRYGRLLTMGDGADDEPVNGLSVVPSGQSLVNGTLSVLGALVLAFDILLGLILALNVPKMIASDVFRDLELHAADVEQLMGAPNWADTVWEVAALFVVVVGLAAMGLLVIARRNAGTPHMVRVGVCGFGFAAAFGLLSQETYYIQWDKVAAAIQDEKIIPAIDAVIRGDFTPSCIATIVLLIASLFVLAWPPHPAELGVAQRRPETMKQRV